MIARRAPHRSVLIYALDYLDSANDLKSVEVRGLTLLARRRPSGTRGEVLDMGKDLAWSKESFRERSIVQPVEPSEALVAEPVVDVVAVDVEADAPKPGCVGARVLGIVHVTHRRFGDDRLDGPPFGAGTSVLGHGIRHVALRSQACPRSLAPPPNMMINWR